MAGSAAVVVAGKITRNCRIAESRALPDWIEERLIDCRNQCRIEGHRLDWRFFDCRIDGLTIDGLPDCRIDRRDPAIFQSVNDCGN
ncbi:MAG TPA: hypothetical protein VFV98_13585 [Vicinamibacterales bacterium]|nr:hypothetical protein [Vicinamibacterales bacterium]